MSRTRNATRKGRIISVELVHATDNDGDLSYLGEYSNKPGAADVTIDRAARGDMGCGEYRYFVAAMSGDESGNPASVEQDYARAEAYNRGDWHMCGVYATAKVTLAGSDVIQTLRSGGLYGIESDSGADYFAEVGKDECDALRAELAACGFGARAIAQAFADVRTVEK